MEDRKPMSSGFIFRPMREHQISAWEAWLGGSYKSFAYTDRDGFRRQTRPGRCARCQEYLEYGAYTYTNHIRRRHGNPPLNFCITCHEQIRATGTALVRALRGFHPDYADLVPAWPKPPSPSLFTKPEAPTYPVHLPQPKPTPPEPPPPTNTTPVPGPHSPDPDSIPDAWQKPQPDYSQLEAGLSGILPLEFDQSRRRRRTEEDDE